MTRLAAMAGVLALVAASAAVVFGELESSTPESAGGKGTELTKEEQDLVERTNAERKKANLPVFVVDPALMKLAREHTAAMARLDQLSHELGGKSFAKRMQESGYRAAGAGENIAQGQRTPGEAVATWMNSPGHKANLLNAKFTRLGVGLASSKSGSPYFTQIFATPAP